MSARLTVSRRAARSLGLGARSTSLGRGVKRLSRAGTAALRLRLSRRARAALRREDAARAKLRVTLTDGDDELALTRTISLRRSAGLRRIVARGMRFWAVCSERCPLTSELSLSRSTARRIGLRLRGRRRVEIAAGRRTVAAGQPTRLTLKVRRGARKALREARSVPTLLDAVAGPSSGPQRNARSRLTLRR